MAEQFEVLVIGGGGAGYTAASTAARLGKRVAMAERGARRRDGAPRWRVRD